MPVRIVTDSTADLPPSLVQELGITVVPLTVLFGEQGYRDGVDIDAGRFMAMLRQARALPRTTQPSPAAFQEVYESITARGDQALSIHISSRLSGTYNSAVLARQALPDPGAVEVVDSRWASMALGLVALQAAEAARAGAGLPETAAAARAAMDRMHLLLFVDTLEYLQRGGRIGKAAAFVGGLLGVKPILTVRDGEVHPVERVRTRGRALDRLREWAAAFDAVQEYCVLHTDSPQDAQTLHTFLQERYPSARSHLGSMGPVIATHVGPGAVGLALLR